MLCTVCTTEVKRRERTPWTEVARRGFSRGVQGQGEGVAKRRGWMQGGQNPSEGFLGEECIESGRLGISVQGPKTPE